MRGPVVDGTHLKSGCTSSFSWPYFLFPVIHLRCQKVFVASSAFFSWKLYPNGSFAGKHCSCMTDKNFPMALTKKNDQKCGESVRIAVGRPGIHSLSRVMPRL